MCAIGIYYAYVAAAVDVYYDDDEDHEETVNNSSFRHTEKLHDATL